MKKVAETSKCRKLWHLERPCFLGYSNHLRMLGRFFASIFILLCFHLVTYSGLAFSDTPKKDIQFFKANQMVLDQNGKQLNFYTDLIKHKTVAINFVFTSCTSSCPLSTAVFRQVQKGSGIQQAQLITISVDPVNDTPEKFLLFSKKFNAQQGWAFITGEKTVISGLLKNLGVYSASKNEHTNMVIVGNDATQTWTRLYGFPQADEIIVALKNVAGKSNDK